jgi:SAM-dependent methyltransferase
MAGARQAFCVELEPIRDPSFAARFLTKLASAALLDPTRVFGPFPSERAQILANLAGFDLAKLAKGDPAGIDANRLVFRQQSVEALGLPDASVDLIVSSSVLEHLRDIDASLAELARITRPGGCGIHGVDTIDHHWYGNHAMHPLDFLTVDSKESVVRGCNRLRLCQFEQAFAQHGFEVVDQWKSNKVPITPELRARLIEPWRSMRDDQHDTTWSQFLLRRR